MIMLYVEINSSFEIIMIFWLKLCELLNVIWYIYSL